MSVYDIEKISRIVQKTMLPGNRRGNQRTSYFSENAVNFLRKKADRKYRRQSSVHVLDPHPLAPTVPAVIMDIALVPEMVEPPHYRDFLPDQTRISVVSAIPPEILSEIFLCCLPFRPTPSQTEAPLLLGRICANWRQIALTTPSLWREICLIEEPSRGLPSLLPVWLARARDCTLLIDIEWQDYDAWNSHLMAICEAIRPFAHRVESLSFDVPETNLARIIGSMFARRPYTAVFVEAPRLDTVSVINDTILPPLPWSQIKRVQLTTFAVHRCLEYMERATNLTYCSISLPTLHWANLPTLQPLHCLVKLYLHHPGSYDNFQECAVTTGPILAALTLPALTELSLYICAASVEDFLSFLDRSTPSLQGLYITTDQDDAAVLRCLTHPAITSVETLLLCFDSVFPTPNILRWLHRPEFLPALRDLSLSESPRHISSSQTYGGLLLDALSRRQDSLLHFRKVSLRTRNGLQVPDVDQLRRVLARGLRLKVETWMGDIESRHHTLQHERAWTPAK
ncbi:hypothetical protein C8R47DRAFT_1204172 [Mycena vitilis]|nr:hypothetical protein C8R47DRAFT_1204172 [Mycena vitilis]